MRSSFGLKPDLLRRHLTCVSGMGTVDRLLLHGQTHPLHQCRISNEIGRDYLLEKIVGREEQGACSLHRKRSNLGVGCHDDLATPQRRNQILGHPAAEVVHRSMPGSLKKFHALQPSHTYASHLGATPARNLDLPAVSLL